MATSIRQPAEHEIAEGWEHWFVLEDRHNIGADCDRTLKPRARRAVCRSVRPYSTQEPIKV